MDNPQKELDILTTRVEGLNISVPPIAPGMVNVKESLGLKVILKVIDLERNSKIDVTISGRIRRFLSFLIIYLHFLHL